ncbi:beta-glucosidase family protein [Rhodanobacter glycinis]|nr:glycoside hydrolase family 3 C-terminal domain-containing protein [Rhodanobacter glycinis]
MSIFAAFASMAAPASMHPDVSKMPWMNKALSPDRRADLVIAQMTLDEKIQLVHGTHWIVHRDGQDVPAHSNYGAGFVPGIDRLGIPGINMADSAVGVRVSTFQGRYATLLPSTLGAASSWNPQAAFLYGSVIGRELRAMGFNMSIGGGVDITREPRNGRNFEYAGEDPLLAGTMTGNLMKGVQAQHLMGDVKHYAFNDQETGRTIYSADINKRAARESDLLAFQIAIGIAHPSGVMCSYNRVNTVYACENHWLLTDVLKKDFGFKGWVLSDWGGTHSTVKAALAGLDQEMPSDKYFGEPLKQAVLAGKVPMSRLDDMDHRILRSMFAAGVIDDPPTPRTVINPFRGRDDAQQLAEESMVLLKNEAHLLPLQASSIRSIALIGSHADVGVPSGGGSAQVNAPGGNAIGPGAHAGESIYFPSSPLKYIREHAPAAKIDFNPGTDPAAAAALARTAQVAIVFVNQPMQEGMDRPTLALPHDQDALVAAVAAANPHTLVVLETGGPVAMPWIDKVQGIVEAWYPGIGGAQALADLLFGNVDFSAKLPVSFPRNDNQLPHPEIAGITATTASKTPVFFDVDYNKAGAAVGYKWFEMKHLKPLFPFGFGLSYTSYAYSGLTVDRDGHTATLTVRNTGQRAGAEIAQVYAVLPKASGETYKRLVGFDRVELAPGESKRITVPLNSLCLSVYDTAKDTMLRLPGTYTILAGPSSADTPLRASFVQAH